MKHIAILLLAILLSGETMFGEQHKLPALKVDFQDQIKQSDIIVVGRVKPSSTGKRHLAGIDCFEIVPQEILKPNVKGAAELSEALQQELVENERLPKLGPIVVEINGRSFNTVGTAPELQEGKKYLFFLKRVNNRSIPSPNIAVELVNLWKGVVALEPASENRAIAGTLDTYDVNIINNPESFIEAIRSTISGKKSPDRKALELKKKLGLE